MCPRPTAALMTALLGVVSAGLLIFSQTAAFYPDEGFHLLAAQLILAGKKPYLDFFYPQAPLYAYFNAGWMWLFGDTWRTAHVFSALMTAAGVALAACFVFTRMRGTRWEFAAGAAAGVFIGLHLLVMRFGTIGQPYGLCLFLIVGAFWLTAESAIRPGKLWPLGAGFSAGAAAGASLLSAPAPVILLAWTIARRRARRLESCLLFLGGAAAAWLPVLWLAAEAPRPALFNLFQYHLFHRRAGYWATHNVALSDLRVLSGWLHSPQSFWIFLLAVLGLLWVSAEREWGEHRRSEMYLCAFLVAGFAAFLAFTHPTFPQYFVVLIPFLGILASVGVYAVGSRLSPRARPWTAPLAALAVFLLGLGKTAYSQRDALQNHWKEIEDIAREIDRVTPEGGKVCAGEAILFAARRLPVSGLENSYSHYLQLTPELAASLHVAGPAEVDKWIAAGVFDTILTWPPDDPAPVRFDLAHRYARRTKVHNCEIFSGKIAASAVNSVP